MQPEIIEPIREYPQKEIFIKIEPEKELSFDPEKLALFEKGLGQELKLADPFNLSAKKIVKMALACEFGASFVVEKENKPLLDKITKNILLDPISRKQALVIIDHFAKNPPAKRNILKK